MRRAYQTILVTFVSAFGAACAGAPKIDAAAEEGAIRALDERWAPAVAASNVEAAVALYTSDATLLWQDTPAAQGTDAIRATWTVVMKTPDLRLSVIPDRIEISVAGDIATDVGRIESQRSTPGGPVSAVSKYLHVWHKVGTEWKLYYSMSNSNSPPPAPAAQKK